MTMSFFDKLFRLEMRVYRKFGNKGDYLFSGVRPGVGENEVKYITAFWRNEKGEELTERIPPEMYADL